MVGNQVLGIRTNVEVKVRKFYVNSRGNEIVKGQRGYYGPWKIQKVHNLLTDAGRDFLLDQGYETTGLSSNGANYIALTTDSGNPADGDTTLTGEITTGGLDRAQGAVTHSNGANSTTIVKTFTASAIHTSVQKSGLFTAAAAGTIVHEATFTSVNLDINDQIAVSWQVSLDD